MGNRYRLAVYALIGFMHWWTHTQRAREAEAVRTRRYQDHVVPTLVARPW